MKYARATAGYDEELENHLTAMIMDAIARRAGGSTNPFLDLAERQTSAPVKARQRAAEKRAATVDKAQAERDGQTKAWRAWRQEQREALLAGPHGADAQALLDFLQTMSIGAAAELIEHVRRGPWQQADVDTRFEVMRLVGDAIVALRERHGMEPFDDALPFRDEVPNAFLVVREELR